MSVPSFDPALANLQPAFDTGQDGTYGLYIHVPFCIQKCSYCSFYSVPGHSKWFDRYVAAVQLLIQQAGQSQWSQGRYAETIFFGGGTPTVLAPEQLAFLLRHCRENLNCLPEDFETSIEVNPATIAYEGLVSLNRAGFNRISIGVQSFDDRELHRLGRIHTAADTLQLVQQARKAGFSNLSLDVMYGLPGQKLSSWQRTLDQALALQPEHLSMYELTIEENTPFSNLAKQGKLDLPDEDEVLAMMDYTARCLEEIDVNRYEISNYARPGYACRHNLNYWQNGSYLGFGPGAVSCRSGRRQTMLADVEEFCRRVQARQGVEVDQEELTGEQRFRETVIMGLRMIDGVSLQELKLRFGFEPVDYYGEVLERLVHLGVLEVAQGRLMLTAQGLLLANAVLCELV